MKPRAFKENYRHTQPVYFGGTVRPEGQAPPRGDVGTGLMVVRHQNGVKLFNLI